MRYILLVLILLPTLRAQGVNDWLRTRIDARVSLKKQTQTDIVSLNRGSTSFVDQSSATDLLSTALSFVPLGKGAQNGEGGASATATLYSIWTLASGKDPLRPVVYQRGAGLRKLSFTIGREEKELVAGAGKGTITSIRFTPWNRRDATSIADSDSTQAELSRIRTEFGASARAVRVLQEYLFNKQAPPSAEFDNFVNQVLATEELVDAAVASLSNAEKAELDGLLDADIQRSAAALEDLSQAVARLERRPQMALDFQTVQRENDGADIYRAQLIFDAGLENGWFVTLNGGLDYADSKVIGGDLRSGRAAGELRYDLVRPPSESFRAPLQVAFGGEGLWAKDDWTYRVQVRLNVPVASGVSIPLSFGYGTPELIRVQEKEVYGKVGISFDFSKVIAAMR